ncbi:hypothetical protein [Pseudomonas syringae]|uniref:hypothetical protein n=1 Tax=Pseudomonas syringae TaxID=317 RepID=UPI00200AF36D|nr:hypothetical protein [Pseudomonas syringae]MCK9779833.1 hypothetical protein [Pseudomonas syringae pv. syringae]
MSNSTDFKTSKSLPPAGGFAALLTEADHRYRMLKPLLAEEQLAARVTPLDDLLSHKWGELMNPIRHAQSTDQLPSAMARALKWLQAQHAAEWLSEEEVIKLYGSFKEAEQIRLDKDLITK